MKKSKRSTPQNYEEAQLALEEAYHRLQSGDNEEAIRVLLSIVPHLIEWGYMELAEQSLHQVLDHGPDPISRASAIAYWGCIEDIRSNYPRALDLFQEALAFYRVAQDSAGTAELLFRIGRIHNARLEFAKARDFFHECIEICNEKKVTKGWAASLLGLGWASQQQTTESGEAQEMYHQSIARARATNDFETLSSAYRQIAFLLWTSRRQQDESKRHIEMALEVSREHNLVQEIAANYTAAAYLYDQWGDDDAAEHSCEQAIQLFRALGDSYGLSNAYANLGRAYESRREFESAAKWYYQSSSLAMAIQNPGTQAYVALRLGIIRRQQERIAESKESLTTALNLAQEHQLADILEEAREKLSQLEE